jgi:S-adenosyl methyltransferase
MTVPPAPPDPEQRPSNARMYDYFLGGYHNFAVDRAAAQGILAVSPTSRCSCARIGPFSDVRCCSR